MKKFLATLLFSVAMVNAAMAVKPPEKPVQPQKQEEALKVGEQSHEVFCLTAKEYNDTMKKEGWRLAVVGNDADGKYVFIVTDLDGTVASVIEVEEDGKTVCSLTDLVDYGVDLLAFKPKHVSGEREAVQ